MTSVQELGTLANNLTHSYSDLATESCRIARVCPAPQVRICLVFNFHSFCRVLPPSFVIRAFTSFAKTALHIFFDDAPLV